MSIITIMIIISVILVVTAIIGVSIPIIYLISKLRTARASSINWGKMIK